MNTEIIEKAVNILNSYKNGDIIEYCDIKGFWIEVNSVENLFDQLRWGHKVRIRPRPTYRPYKNAAEFIKESRKHGDWVCAPGDRNCYKIVECNDTAVYVAYSDVAIRDVQTGACKIGEYTYDSLLSVYTWADDRTLCGILEDRT